MRVDLGDSKRWFGVRIRACKVHHDLSIEFWIQYLAAHDDVLLRPTFVFSFLVLNKGIFTFAVSVVCSFLVYILFLGLPHTHNWQVSFDHISFHSASNTPLCGAEKLHSCHKGWWWRRCKLEGWDPRSFAIAWTSELFGPSATYCVSTWSSSQQSSLVLLFILHVLSFNSVSLHGVLGVRGNFEPYSYYVIKQWQQAQHCCASVSSKQTSDRQ